MIREATHADIPRLLEMGEKFAAKAGLVDHCGYDPESMAATFSAMIERDEFCLFIGEAGAIGGMKAPHPFNHAKLMADELFWWSEGREGLRLLEAYEEWAGDAMIRMTTLEAVNPDRMSKFYQRRGYQPLERVFVKV
jgi:GNAT superfamily N-acetyltransferase